MNKIPQLTVLKCKATLGELPKNKSMEADEALTANPFLEYVCCFFSCNYVISVLGLLVVSVLSNPHFAYTFMVLASHYLRKI